MNARRVLEDVLVPLTIVAPPPATVTQRTCLEHFGISPRDYLRFASESAFPVSDKGKLRVARYADVEHYLTDGARVKAKRAHAKTPDPKPTTPVDPVEAMDPTVVLRRLGFRPRR